MGCHQFIPGQKTILMGLKQYQDVQEQLPPKLLTEGARVDPEWLRKFLSNPALSTADTNRNGVRPYLKVRMPTFSFSDNDLRKLLTDYIFQLTPEEQRRVAASMPRAKTAALPPRPNQRQATIQNHSSAGGGSR